jgi:hypothetical protein
VQDLSEKANLSYAERAASEADEEPIIFEGKMEIGEIDDAIHQLQNDQLILSGHCSFKGLHNCCNGAWLFGAIFDVFSDPATAKFVVRPFVGILKPAQRETS